MLWVLIRITSPKRIFLWRTKQKLLPDTVPTLFVVLVNIQKFSIIDNLPSLLCPIGALSKYNLSAPGFCQTLWNR